MERHQRTCITGLHRASRLARILALSGVLSTAPGLPEIAQPCQDMTIAALACTVAQDIVVRADYSNAPAQKIPRRRPGVWFPNAASVRGFCLGDVPDDRGRGHVLLTGRLDCIKLGTILDHTPYLPQGTFL